MDNWQVILGQRLDRLVEDFREHGDLAERRHQEVLRLLNDQPRPANPLIQPAEPIPPVLPQPPQPADPGVPVGFLAVPLPQGYAGRKEAWFGPRLAGQVPLSQWTDADWNGGMNQERRRLILPEKIRNLRRNQRCEYRAVFGLYAELGEEVFERTFPCTREARAWRRLYMAVKNYRARVQGVRGGGVRGRGGRGRGQAVRGRGVRGLDIRDQQDPAQEVPAQEERDRGIRGHGIRRRGIRVRGIRGRGNRGRGIAPRQGHGAA